MLDHARRRLTELQARMREAGAELALFTSEDSIAYLAGFWGYLGVEFGRPTFLIVRPDDPPVIVTPLMERDMVAAMSWVQDIRPWEDSGPRGWPSVLLEALGETTPSVWIERNAAPRMVFDFLAVSNRWRRVEQRDVSPILGAMRMVKASEEIAVMRQAGKVGEAMMAAAQASVREGAAEYESALAVSAAGSRAAAEMLSGQGWEAFVSPLIHGLQILQSGPDVSMVHRRAGLRRYRRGDPVYFCFCNLIRFKQYKLGFDRMFHVGQVSDAAARLQQTAIDAQQAAIAAIRPGVLAQDVAAAANEVYAARGLEPGYRVGRSIGVAWLEAPELKAGDRTPLMPGMTFAVDGGVALDGVGAGRIGDSVVVTQTGCDYLTEYPREVTVV